MKKIRLLFILNLAFLIFNSQIAKAQWVTIPDANFVTWLTTNYPTCMNGSQMDTTCSGIVNATTLNVFQSNISDLTGVRYFDNLITLNCQYNTLTSLPALPHIMQRINCFNNQISNFNTTFPLSLRYINCSWNQLTTLQTLPNQLDTLICQKNNLTALPVLPNSIRFLDCFWNQITSLSTLPTSLKYFECSNNQIASISTLPATLEIIHCYHNQLTSITNLPNTLWCLDCLGNNLTSLPSLPNSLRLLECQENQLTSLPTLPNSLRDLYCNNNQLTSLPVLPNKLRSITCSNNILTSLPILPDSLGYLNCTYNLLSTLPTLPTDTFTTLYCYFNQLTSLPTLPNSLSLLWCDYNQLTTLPVLPNSLGNLRCGHNQLTSLPQLPNSLYSLSCSHNQLTSMPALPGVYRLFCDSNQLTSLPQVLNTMAEFYIQHNNISCFVNLPFVYDTSYVDISDNDFVCVPNQTNYSLGLPLCIANDPSNNPYNCQTPNITGYVYTDQNGDCIYNGNDLPTENIPIKLYDNQNNLLAQSFTVNGMYSFASLLPDTFKVKIDDNLLPVAIACGQTNNRTVMLDSANQSISNINFPVVCDTGFDIKVESVSSQGLVFPGQIHTLFTNISNNEDWYNLNCGTSNNSGTVSIQITGPVTYISPATGALTPSINGNTFTFGVSNFHNLAPHSFGLKFMTNTNAQAGNQICVHVTILTAPSDANNTNNVYDYCYNVVNSYDPNMKEMYPINTESDYSDWFTYTIHFQNTGNAPAININLKDTLDINLDLNTFEMIGYSHSATTTINGNVLSVRFNNIMLPDSTSNYQGSMGYYQYRIKPLQNLPGGTNIKNTAYIYFDYNPAVVTNTTQSQFNLVTYTHTILPQVSRLWLHPNPSTGIFTFNDAKNLKTIEVYNIFGQLILSQGNTKQIDLQAFPKGIYFAKVNGEFVSKLVKE